MSLDKLVRIIEKRGITSDPEILARFLGRGVITPAFIFDRTGSEEAHALAEQLRNELWPNYIHPTRRMGVRALRRRGLNVEVDQATQWARWAKKNGVHFEKVKG